MNKSIFRVIVPGLLLSLIVYNIAISHALAVNGELNMPPSGVEATDGEFNDTVMLVWDALENAAYYHVYRSATSSGPYIRISDDIHGTVFYDRSVNMGIGYYYKVCAFSVHDVKTPFSDVSVGWAEEGGFDGPEFIQGKPVLRGTYVAQEKNVNTNMTYTFGPEGSCIKIHATPESPWQDHFKMKGTWQQKGSGLVINTFTDQKWYQIRFIENWENVFTTHAGKYLYLISAKQIKPDGDEYMKFAGSGDVQAILYTVDADNGTYAIPVELTINIYEDGSGSSVFTRGNNDPVTKFWPANPDARIKLIEFRGAYFFKLPEDKLFISR